MVKFLVPQYVHSSKVRSIDSLLTGIIMEAINKATAQRSCGGLGRWQPDKHIWKTVSVLHMIASYTRKTMVCYYYILNETEQYIKSLLIEKPYGSSVTNYY